MRLIDADALIRDIDCSADLGGALGKVVECVKLYAKYMIQTAPTISSQLWIPVSVSLPAGGHNIIFCTAKGTVCEGVYHAMLGQWVGFRWNTIYHHDDVTAWMPLPEPMELEMEETNETN